MTDKPADHEVRFTYGVPSTLEILSRRKPKVPCWQALPCFYAPITPATPERSGLAPAPYELDRIKRSTREARIGKVGAAAASDRRQLKLLRQ